MPGTIHETWTPATRVAFRFCFLYLGLFALATQITGSLVLIPGVYYRGIGQLSPMRDITTWVATRVLDGREPFDPTGASGETIFFLSQTLWLLALAILLTLVWSLVDSGRTEYSRLHKWFRLFIRLALASQMFEYGMTKIIPVQFASPSLSILVTPAGDLSLNTMLWTSIGASTGYQVFTGFAELLGGVLLLVPRTTLAGALVCLADMIHVLVLNLGFDIGLKITSFHLVLLAVFLLAPELGRLEAFLLGREVGVSREPPLMATRRGRSIAVALQLALGVYLIGMQTLANVNFWYAEGGGAPKSPLYGIWNVESLSLDAVEGPPSQNDYDRRWRRVIFDAPEVMTFQRTDDSLARYGVSIDLQAGTLRLTKGGSRSWESVFDFRRPAENRLVLDGEMDGYAIRAELERVEFDTFRLLNSDFRWIRPDEPVPDP
jgi:hypothetical protein